MAVLTVVVLATAAAAVSGRLPIVQRVGESGAAAAAASPSLSPAAAVLAPVSDSGPQPTQPGVAARLGPLLGAPALGNRLGIAVVDLATGALVYGKDPDTAMVPASTTKLLTAAAVLSRLGPEHRISTRVVVGATPDRIVLVGGGDTTLVATPVQRSADSPASLVDLAAQTATALKAVGVTRVTLGYDASLFAGPTSSPAWPADDLTTGVIAPVTALTVRAGRIGPGSDESAPREADPPAAAARTFATLLADRGVTVADAPTPDRAPPAPSGTPASPSAGASPSSGAALVPGEQLAAVSSPTMADLVATMLTLSDDDLAEALGHLVAVADGQPADFAGAARSVLAEVAGLGVPVAGVRLFDTSGLSHDNAIPPRVLTAVLAAADRPDRPNLRALLAGLPVAGFTGTLDNRFQTDRTRAAAGLVRAKTGTLESVGSLAGTVLDASGRLLGFALLSDQFPAGAALDNRAALDRLAAALAGCGCGAAPTAPTVTASPSGS